jgi:hypothetical protein
MKFYHVTDFENMMPIREYGLKANSKGYIFVFSEINLANYIACGQLALKDYVLFEVDVKGLKLENDEVNELFSSFQFKIKTELIKPNDIKFIDIFKSSELEYKTLVKKTLGIE